MRPYHQDIQQLNTELASSISSGLSDNEVINRQKIHGKNIIPRKPPESIFFIFLRQFQSPLIYILLIAASIIYFVGKELDAFIISGILLFNALIGTIQEGRAHNILESLRKYITSQALVIRDGKHQTIPAEDLVVGDIILIQEGQKIPADARIIIANNLLVDEAILTGESQAIMKIAVTLPLNTSLADQKNMLFNGTYAVSGNAQAIVTAIGTATEIGKIGKDIEEIDTDLPLKKKLDHLAQTILFVIFFQTIFLFVIGYFTNKPTVELLTSLVALFICTVPEGLPVVLTLALVAGARNMAKKQVLAKRLQAVEGLGLTDTIILDKTGTLTRNELMVSCIYTDKQYVVSGNGYYPEGEVLHGDVSSPALCALARAGILLNKAEINFDYQSTLFHIIGDPTDAALGVFGKKVIEPNNAIKNYEKIFELPFDAQKKYKAAFYRHGSEITAYIVGAPEVILNKSHATHDARKELDILLKDGLRVIGAAQKTFGSSMFHAQSTADYHALLTDLEFLGFYGIQDAIRPDAAMSVKRAQDAGISVIMATGDHKDTALYVARTTGIFKNGDQILTGQELDALSDEELAARIKTITVFARVNPQQKLRIIQALHTKKEIVAMTGDGVNDAPALIAADLGIAMGNIGTEVAKKAADLILLQDSFAHIIDAIKEGRHIFFTLQRVIIYFFTTNLAEVLIVFCTLISNLPLPLTAAQILWLNFITDGFLDVSLVAEPQESDILMKKISSREQLINKNLIAKIITMSLPMTLGSFGVFLAYYQHDLVLARTMALATMAMFQWFNAWNCRSLNKSLFEIGLFSNRWLLAATSFVLSLQIAIIYLPFMQKIFGTVPLSGMQWLIVVALSSTILWIKEARIALEKIVRS